MAVEFISPTPDEPNSPDDVLEAGRPRRNPKLVNAALAAVLVAGGIGWYVSRPDSHPAAAPSTTAPSALLPLGAPYATNELLGCPDTLACDANHQMPGHVINLIKKSMRQAALARHSAHEAALPHAGQPGVGRIYPVG